LQWRHVRDSVMNCDIQFTPLSGNLRLEAVSPLGMLWLQQRFEPCAWELVASGDVRIRPEAAEALQRAGEAAGLEVRLSRSPAPPAPAPGRAAGAG
jgi:hypothetical protein